MDVVVVAAGERVGLTRVDVDAALGLAVDDVVRDEVAIAVATEIDPDPAAGDDVLEDLHLRVAVDGEMHADVRICGPERQDREPLEDHSRREQVDDVRYWSAV